MNETPVVHELLLRGDRRRTHWPGLVLGLAALLGAAALADWFTGPEIAFSIMYLPPIGLAAWRGGHWFGLVVAGVAGALWLTVELMTNTGYSSPWIPYWNGLVRLTIFCLVAVLTAEVVERKRVEDALEHQRGILQSILDSMREGVVVTGREGRLLLMNPAAEALLDVEGLSPRPETAGALLGVCRRERGGQGILARALRGELVPEAEVCLEDAKSESCWVRVHGRPWLDPDGRNHGSMVVLSDITGRRNLERQIAMVSDREQRRLGQDLHDGLCQHLVSVAFAARVLGDNLAGRQLPEARDAARISDLLEESVALAKDVARGLYLVPLETGGLAAALMELAEQIQGRFGVACVFQEQGELAPAAVGAVNDLFRIAQEAVMNAVKHSSAKRIQILLQADPSRIVLRVTDDGCGLPVSGGQDRGLGLHMMRYRARMIGAELEVTSTKGSGTVVQCTMALRGRTEAGKQTEVPHA